MRHFAAILFFIAFSGLLHAQKPGTRQIHVFVALCDNAFQGIVPVPAKIGNGDDPKSNLYWGCAEGFQGIFGNSAAWRLTEEPVPPKKYILKRMVLEHVRHHAVLTADAYKGSEIKQCIRDFEAMLAARECDLAVYLGHNGLMDFQLPDVEPASVEKSIDVVALCCKSKEYFLPRLAKLGAHPVLLTTQLMYPGAFVLRDVFETWISGGNADAIREAAAKAYAVNQKISHKAALDIFARLPGNPSEN